MIDSVRSSLIGKALDVDGDDMHYFCGFRLFGTMKIGEGFSGCLYQGPGVNFTSVGFVTTNITWDVCMNRGCSKGEC